LFIPRVGNAPCWSSWPRVRERVPGARLDIASGDRIGGEYRVAGQGSAEDPAVRRWRVRIVLSVGATPRRPQRTRARGTVTRGRLNHGCESFRDHIAAESRYAPSNSGSSLSRREVRAGASVAIHASFCASASATENLSTCSSGREILAATWGSRGARSRV
jgi:hypothetical protein